MSWQMRAIVASGRLIRRPPHLRHRRHRPQVPVLTQTHRRTPTAADRSGRYQVTRAVVDRFACYTVQSARRTAKAAAEPSLIYVHGGAYVSEISSPHWRLIANLADTTQHPVHGPLYGLAPRHCAEQAIDFVGAILTRAATRGPLHVAGD